MILEKKKTATILIALFMISAFAVVIPVGAQTTWTVKVSGGDFTSIQDAVLSPSVLSGDTILVATGTYAEGIIVIDKDLTIIGDSGSKPVINPTSDLTGNYASDAWFLVKEGISFDLSNVELNGESFFVYQAIRSHGYTTINNVDFINIQGSTSGTPYRGVAIQSYGGTVPGGGGSDSHSGGLAASHLTVTESTFAQIGRIGVVVKGTESIAEIVGCTYTGKGTGDYLDYAFEAGAGGDITVEDCVITNCLGVASVDGSTSAGIYVTDYYGTGTSAIITGNTISGTSCAIAVGYDEDDVSDVVAHHNNLADNVYGVESIGPQVDATLNWWGVTTSFEIAFMKTGDVLYDPWLDSSYPGGAAMSSGSATMSVHVELPKVSITVTPANVDFGAIVAGESSTEFLLVANTGDTDVYVEAILSPGFDPLYSHLAVTPSTFTIAETDEAQSVDLTLTVPQGFTPGTYEGTLVFWATGT